MLIEQIVCHFRGKTEDFSIVDVSTPTALKGQDFRVFMVTVVMRSRHNVTLYTHCICNKQNVRRNTSGLVASVVY